MSLLPLSSQALYNIFISKAIKKRSLLIDEDIATLDTPTLWSSSSCNSSPTQLPCHPRIQQTRRHCFGHNSLIRHRNMAFLDALERGRWRRPFGSGPSSRRSVDYFVWPRQGVASPIWANLAMYRVGP
jgi:hypothetical protein